MFMAQEGAFYVSDKVGAILADQFAKLGVQPGQPIEITKAEAGRGPERRTQWIVATLPVEDATLAVLVVPDPPPAAPTELEQQPAASIKMVEARKQAQQATAAAPAWATFLVAQSNALVDCYSQVLTHASKYPNVRGEDVRSIFLSTFINVSKGGKSNAA
jgi:hypothetical protein